MQVSYSHKHTKADLQQLQSLLAPLLSPILSSTRSLRVLNLACGRADESGILARLLKPYAPELQVVGVDIRAPEIQEANARWRHHIDCEFLVQDAAKLHELRELGCFDIGFMRHQNYWNGDMTWQRIYDNALHRLKPGALLIITSYFDKEHLLALAALQQLGAELLTSITNPTSRIISDAPNKSADRHVAIFRRP